MIETNMKEKTSFEEALNSTGFGMFNIGMLLVCSLLVIAMVFEAISVSYLVAASSCELGTSTVQQGLIAGMPLVGIIATSHIWGYLADTRGRRKILLISLILGFSMGVSSAFSPNWIVLSLLKMISCSAVSGTYALAMTLLSECTPEGKRSIMIMLATSVYMISDGLMAVLTIPILPLNFSYSISFLNIHFNSWRLLCLIYTMPCALGALGVYFCNESPKYLLSIGQEDQALKMLKRIYVINNKKGRGEFKVQSVVLVEELPAKKEVGLWRSLKSQTIPLVKPPLRRSTIILSFLCVGTYMCINPYLIWLPTISDSFMKSVERGETGQTFCQMLKPDPNVLVLNEANACVLNKTAMLTVLGISLLFASLNTIVSSIINLVGRRRLLIGIQVLSGTVGLCVNLSSNMILGSVLFVIYLSPMLDIGLITTYTVDIYPTHLRAMAVSLSLMMGRGSAVIGINLLKNMLVHNCEASFYLFSAIVLVCGAIAFTLPAD